MGRQKSPKGDEAEWSDDDGDFEYVGQPIARSFDGRLVLGKVTGFLRQLEGPCCGTPHTTTAILKIWNTTRSCRACGPSPSTPPKLPEKRSATAS